MKLERQLAEADLFNYTKRHLPQSLVTRRRPEGYVICYYIYQRDHTPWLFERGDPVAEIYGLTLRLFHNNYFSDMEALARAYEAATGFEVTLIYQQVPKEKSLGFS